LDHASSRQPCYAVASYLASCISWLCRRWIFEFPRISHPSAVLVIKSPGCPESLHPQQRFPMRLRVSPFPASSGCAGDGSSSFLEFRILQRCRPNDSPGYPDSSLFQQRLMMRLRVSPFPASSGCASGEASGLPASSPSAAERWISGFPRFSHLPAFPAMKPRVAPVLASSGFAWW